MRGSRYDGNKRVVMAGFREVVYDGISAFESSCRWSRFRAHDDEIDFVDKQKETGYNKTIIRRKRRLPHVATTVRPPPQFLGL
jgi:hypothetical protein